MRFFGWISRFYSTDTLYIERRSGFISLALALWLGCFALQNWKMGNVLTVLRMEAPVWLWIHSKCMPTRRTAPSLPANEPSIIIIVNNLCEIARYTLYKCVPLPVHVWLLCIENLFMSQTPARFILNASHFWNQIHSTALMCDKYTRANKSHMRVLCS